MEDPMDNQALKNMIRLHFEATGSPRAEWILNNWLSMLPKFVKVFPHEYKRVMNIPRLAEPMTSTIRPQESPKEVIHG